jgi:hypothetical protein
VNETPQQLPNETQTALQNCFAQIRLARATELAQSERFFEAEAVLMPDGEHPDRPRELDLLARIATRQGNFDVARRLWTRALQNEPENEIYKQCLSCLTPARRIPRLIERSLDALLPVLVWGMVALSIGVLVFVFFFMK